MENINKIQIVPDEVYEIGVDKAPVIPEWSVKDDSTLYEKVNKLAHSTFDRSKFTVVGSPSITDDGIASGFTTTSFIQQNLSQITQPFKIIGSFNSGTLSGGHKCLLSLDTGWSNPYLWIDGTGFFAYMHYTDDTSTGDRKYAIIDANTDYYFALEFTGSAVYLYLSTDKRTLFDVPYLVKNTSAPPKISKISIGNHSTGDYPFTGSIDLKQFSITVDGVEVFSGNKTGIDTIKPDDYTPEGSIASNITDDGMVVCTTTGSTDYIDKSISIPQGSKLRIEVRLRTPKGINASGSTGASWLRCYLSNTLKLQTYMSYWGFTFAISGVGTGNVLERSIASDTWYKFLIEYDGADSYTFNVKKESDTTWTSVTKTGVTPSAFDKIRINSELNNTTGGYTFDLNAFKIYVDGDLVYQPCLKIPYTESKTGSKIVDSIYRDRVKDLFEQEGYNIYYTLGEDDFTLPSNKPNDIVKYKANGLTVAEQRADQTLTIRGACESGTDVNLPMDFFDGDSYAVFGVGTTGTNTASKFTPAADGNYIAIGKGKV